MGFRWAQGVVGVPVLRRVTGLGFRVQGQCSASLFIKLRMFQCWVGGGVGEVSGGRKKAHYASAPDSTDFLNL